MADEERKKRHTTGSKLTYKSENVDAAISIDSKVWAAIKNNKKFVALCLLFGLNLMGNVSIRDLTVMNRKEIVSLQDKVKDYDALQKEVAMCKETQAKQLEQFQLVEQLMRLLKNNRPAFRNQTDRREFDEVTTKILRIKPISQNQTYAGGDGAAGTIRN